MSRQDTAGGQTPGHVPTRQRRGSDPEDTSQHDSAGGQTPDTSQHDTARGQTPGTSQHDTARGQTPGHVPTGPSTSRTGTGFRAGATVRRERRRRGRRGNHCPPLKSVRSTLLAVDLGLEGAYRPRHGRLVRARLATAEALAAEGANVSMFARGATCSSARPTASARSQCGATCRSRGSRARRRRRPSRRFGGIDVLRGSSGGPTPGPATTVTPETLEQAIEVLFDARSSACSDSRSRISRRRGANRRDFCSPRRSRPITSRSRTPSAPA